jgi:hypothetical protein
MSLPLPYPWIRPCGCRLCLLGHGIGGCGRCAHAWRTTNEKRAPITSFLVALYKHREDIILIISSYTLIYTFMSFGLDPGDWHDGASGSRRHYPAQVSGLDPGGWHHGAQGAVTTIPHGCPALIRAGGTTGRCWGGHHCAARWIGQERPWGSPPNVDITRAAGRRRKR